MTLGGIGDEIDRAREALDKYLRGLDGFSNGQVAAAKGQPEDQLKRPVGDLVEALALIIGHAATTAVSESRNAPAAEGAIPDIAVMSIPSLLLGHIELKAPEKGIRERELVGADKVQYKKFCNLPNLAYTNGRDFRLLRTGEEILYITLAVDPFAAGAPRVIEWS